MKKALLILLILFTGNVMASSLPNCSPYISSIKWNNCFGTFTWDDGDKYVGEYKDGKKNGQGTYTYAEYGKYIGEWKDNQWNGQGTYTYANGDKYVGEWKDDKMYGLGTYTWTDGTSDTGYWLKGKFIPDICEDMGLTKGSDGFSQCVLKLMDD